jgi:CheY-like chemotaxis protein
MISTHDGTTPSDAGDTALIAVVARSRETRMALSSAIEARGYQSVMLADPSAAAIHQAAVSQAAAPQASSLKPQAALWDTSPDAASNAAAVRRVLAVVDGAPLLALIGFPRAGDVALARAAGVAAVIAKPYLLDDVFWRLERLCRQRDAALRCP